MPTTAGRRGRPAEGGFTLVELIVTVSIIAVLTAVAIPVMLSQQAKARDAAGRADAGVVHKMLVTYYGESGTPPVVTTTGGRWTVDGVDGGPVSPGVGLGTHAAVPAPTATADTTGWTPSGWCLDVLVDGGSVPHLRVVPTGVETGVCP